MIAIVEIGGRQFTVKVGDVIDVNVVENEIGSSFSLSPLFVSGENGESSKIGTPVLEGSKVEFKVVENFKGDKVTVFKMKSKKRFARTKGFRQSLSKLEVVSIV